MESVRHTTTKFNHAVVLMLSLWQCTSDEMKLLKPVNLITADPDRDVAATADLETPLIGHTSEVSVYYQTVIHVIGF